MVLPSTPPLLSPAILSKETLCSLHKTRTLRVARLDFSNAILTAHIRVSPKPDVYPPSSSLQVKRQCKYQCEDGLNSDDLNDGWFIVTWLF